VVGVAQHQHDFVLGHVRVLIFVDQDVLEPLLVLRQHVLVFAKQLHGVHKQVVEIHRPGVQQT